MICLFIKIGFIIATIGFIINTVLIDVEHLIKKEYIENHTSRWIQRLMFFCIVGLYDVWYGIGSTLLFIAFFDQLINYSLNRSFWYVGTTAKWDIFFSDYPNIYKAIKILSLMGATICYL